MPEPLREIVNVYLDDDRRTLVVRERVDGRTVTRRVRAEHVTWHRDDDLTKAMRQQLSALPTVRSVKRQGKWVRVCWSDHYAREDGRRGMKANQIDTFEGDVDPVLLFLVEDGGKIAKPRRCYLDIETDSRVPLSQKENMRVLSWVLVDHDTGEETIGVLEQESDADERRLLQVLADAMLPYDQVCVWEGNWSGGEFDSVVVPARWRATGVIVDERTWIWTNQLAVWDRHSSAESGAEGSLKLDVIAHEQLGEGKEQVPQFVIDRFGEDRCKRGLGMLAWDLWEAGGRFRQLLLRYNAKDARLLRMLELRKGFIALALALASLCGLNPIDRSMDPTRLMDGFMLRLGRKQDRRFATRERFEKEDMPKKFKGAVVFPPKSVPNEKPKDGEEPWSSEQAAVWRRDHGFKNGILHGVHVCDFSGMYPSIMMTFNLGAEMIAGWAKDPKELKPGHCMSPGTGLVTRLDEHAPVTFAFREMARLRKHYADLASQLPPGTPEWIDAMAMSTAFKVAMNSFYGAGGTPFSRFYNRDVSEATTQNAVYFLRLAAEEAKKRKMVIAYGDSITGDRTVVVKDPRGHVRIVPIAVLWNEVSKTVAPNDRGKDVASPRGWLALTEKGWCKLRHVIRHNVEKSVHMISTKHGQVRVTNDHSIMCGGREMTPGEFVVEGAVFDKVDAPHEEPEKVIDLLEHVDGVEFPWAKGDEEGTRRFVDAGDGWIILTGGPPKAKNPSRIRVRRFYKRNTPEWEALLRLVGAYVSDGSASLGGGITTKRFMLSFCKADLRLQKQVALDLRSIFEGTGVQGPFWTETVYVVRSGTATMACLFAAMCGWKSRGKRLPAFAYRLGMDGYEILEQALLDGDGSTDASGAFIFTSNSQQLIAGVSYLLSQHRRPHSFSYREEKQAWSVRTRKGIERKTRYSIKHQVDVNFRGDVYDLSVDGAHTFVDGIGRVLLHNTDSSYVVGPSIDGFAKFTSWLNEHCFPAEVKRHGCTENHIKIAYEKSYDRVIFVTKKRYVARYLFYKHTSTCNHCRVTGRGDERRVLREDEPGGEPGSVDIRTLTCRDCGHVYDQIPKFLGKPEIKGVAYKRGETTVLARELQAKVIDLLVGGLTLKGDDGKEAPANPGVETPTEDVSIYRSLIERYQDRILVGELRLQDVVHSKGLSKSLRDFAKDASDAHVRVARMLLERGQHVARGMKIEYVVVDGSVSPQRVVPAEDFVGECDRFHLWEQAWEPSKQLLQAAFPDEAWNDWDAPREKKRKGKKSKELEGQLGLAIAEPVKAGERKLSAEDEVAIPSYRSADLRIEIPESAGKDGVDRVLATLMQHPGARSVVVIIKLTSGHEAIVKTPLRVSPGPKLRLAIDAAVAGPPPTEHAPS